MNKHRACLPTAPLTPLSQRATMLLPIFTLNLNQRVLPGRVTLGEFDGRHPCLAAATTAEKVCLVLLWCDHSDYQVLVHNPHQRMGHMSGRMVASSSSQELSMLNINQRILSLAAGKLDERVERDVLAIGTPTTLLAYDVENNSDLFFKEVIGLGV